MSVVSEEPTELLEGHVKEFGECTEEWRSVPTSRVICDSELVFVVTDAGETHSGNLLPRVLGVDDEVVSATQHFEVIEVVRRKHLGNLLSVHLIENLANLRSFPTGSSAQLRHRLILHGIAPEAPTEGMAVPGIPLFDERHDLFTQVVLRDKAPMLEATAMKNREEEFNLIHPRCMQRSVHKLEAVIVSLVEASAALGRTIVMDVEVVPDHYDSLGVRVSLGYVIHERHQVFCGPSWPTGCRDISGTDIERRQQRLSAMTNVFAFVTAGPSGNRTPCFMFALSGLHSRLFIDAEDNRIIGRIEVPRNHGIDSLPKLRVSAMHPQPQPMWLQSVPVQSAPHARPTHRPTS